MKDGSMGDTVIQKKVNGVLSNLYVGACGYTGTLKIILSGGTISFYDGSTQLYSQTYNLASTSCYLYAFMSSNTYSYCGTDVFDDFEYHLLNP
jgi:hypothetical protein